MNPDEEFDASSLVAIELLVELLLNLLFAILEVI